MLDNRGCGYTLQEIHEKGGYLYDEWNKTYKKYEKGMIRQDGSIGFATPSGRIELMPYSYTAWGLERRIFQMCIRDSCRTPRCASGARNA